MTDVPACPMAGEQVQAFWSALMLLPTTLQPESADEMALLAALCALLSALFMAV